MHMLEQEATIFGPLICAAEVRLSQVASPVKNITSSWLK